jgi:hypothetical protein
VPARAAAHPCLGPPRWRRADLLLAAWFLLWCAFYVRHGGLAWHFFVQGERALGDGDDPLTGGLHLYAGLPQLQIGPISLAAAWLLSPAGPAVSLRLAQAVGAAAGLALIPVAAAVARHARPDLAVDALRRRLRLAAACYLPAWLYLAVASVHLDDVLALLCGHLAVLAAVRRRPLLAGLLLGLAVDAKPWALTFAAILLVLPGWWARARGAAITAVTVGAAWLPFLVADPRTLAAVRFTIPNTAYTALRVLGVDSARTPPWDRPAQALLGLGLAALAVRRGRWAAVPLVAVMARIVLDPGTNMYYPAGVTAGALLWDVAGSRRRLPWWTASALVGLVLARKLPVPPHLDGSLTLAYFVACVWLAARPAQAAGARRRAAASTAMAATPTAVSTAQRTGAAGR